MRISHKHQFVFLANPRTGSTTLRNLLDPYSDIRSVHISEITETFPFYHHISAQELKIVFDLRDWDWDAYRRFAVVRNPYDRVVSLFHHHRWRIEHNNAGVRPVASFSEFVDRLSLQRRLTAPLEAFICDAKGRELVSDVFRFEELQRWMPEYFGRLGVSLDTTDIPVLNASKQRQDYREYYNDETRNKVGAFYAYEIERFGYEF